MMEKMKVFKNAQVTKGVTEEKKLIVLRCKDTIIFECFDPSTLESVTVELNEPQVVDLTEFLGGWIGFRRA